MKQLKGTAGHRPLFNLLLAQGHRDAPDSQLGFSGKFKNVGKHRPKKRSINDQKTDQIKALRDALDKMVERRERRR